MSYWKEKSVLVTGGSGFLGSFVIEELQKKGAEDIHYPRSAEFDLRDPKQIDACLTKTAPDIIIHLAAVVGGIGANRIHPGSFFYDNAIMGISLLEACRKFNIQKTTILGTICAYPKFTPIPFSEENLWSGYPEETNAPYGLAKKMLLVQSQAYRQEYGMNSIYLLPVNLYGPRDNFDPESSHVIPALIRKIIQARDSGSDHIVCWGSGTATREFLYVEDCAKGILAATEKYNSSEPVNLGSGMEISIRELAETIIELVGYELEIKWDESKPDGQPRRCLSIERAENEFGFKAGTDFKEGLKKTIAWYDENKHLIE